MRPSSRWLTSLGRLSVRPNSTSFIGLGRMGWQMASNLFAKQYAENTASHFVVCDAIPAIAHDFSKTFLTQFPGANMVIAESPEAATHASQTIVTMLPSSPQVQEVYGRIASTLSQMKDAQDTVFIDSTTLDVSVAQDVAKSIQKFGAHIVDAPVSGGVTGAKAGTLSFLVGGTESAFKLVHPILATMGLRIIHCGPSGSGLGAKICNNMILGVQQIVVSEAMLLGEKLGLDPAVLTSVISNSTGQCWSLSVNNPVPHSLPGKSPPCERDYEGGFATSLMLKDMGLATGLAERTGTAIPMGKTAAMLYQEIIDKKPALASKDFSCSYLALKDTY
ncbi:3-hydroxyisobutyrate dehydrogenase [Mycena floridula]|nr:3-hydroxyisobutyrate dehydrogenase [Mycena floridula]